MADFKGLFKCVVMTPDGLIYENDVYSVFLTGTRGEYELLAYHYPVLGIIDDTRIIINWKEGIRVNFGVVKFFANECIILVEEKERVDKVLRKETEKDLEVDVDMEDRKNII